MERYESPGIDGITLGEMLCFIAISWIGDIAIAVKKAWSSIRGGYSEAGKEIATGTIDGFRGG